MKITKYELKRIIAEEYARVQRTKSRRPRRRLAEGTMNDPVRITPEYLNRIIREEYEAYQRNQRLVEARRRRARARRLAEARRRSARNYY